MTSNITRDALAVLRAEDVTREYGPAKGIFAVSFCLNQGEIISVIGPNGCGKTTLLRCLGGFESLDRGAVEIASRYALIPGAGASRDGYLDQVRGEVLGTVFQHYTLFPHLSVQGNLLFPLREKLRMDTKAALGAITPLLEEFDLKDHLQLMPHQLSGGLRQRVALARCLLLKPRILLLDEVTSGLDPDWAERVATKVTAFAKAGGAVLNVSHQLGLVKSLSDRVMFLFQGRLEWCGQATQLDLSDNPLLEKFIRTA